MKGDRRYYVQRYDEVVQGIIDFLSDSRVTVKQAKYALRTAWQHIENTIISNGGVAVISDFDPTDQTSSCETQASAPVDRASSAKATKRLSAKRKVPNP